MSTTTTRRVAAMVATVCVGTAAVTASAAAGAAPTRTPPPWNQCAYADHPPAADLGPLMPATWEPPAEVVAVLMREVEVGTDCSIYDPMMSAA